MAQPPLNAIRVRCCLRRPRLRPRSSLPMPPWRLRLLAMPYCSIAAADFREPHERPHRSYSRSWPGCIQPTPSTQSGVPFADGGPAGRPMEGGVRRSHHTVDICREGRGSETCGRRPGHCEVAPCANSAIGSGDCEGFRGTRTRGSNSHKPRGRQPVYARATSS